MMPNERERERERNSLMNEIKIDVATTVTKELQDAEGLHNLHFKMQGNTQRYKTFLLLPSNTRKSSREHHHNCVLCQNGVTRHFNLKGSRVKQEQEIREENSILNPTPVLSLQRDFFSKKKWLLMHQKRVKNPIHNRRDFRRFFNSFVTHSLCHETPSTSSTSQCVQSLL